MSGAAGFIEDVRRQLRIGDRQIAFRNNHSLAAGRYDDVYVNFYNLPRGIGSAGGGAEAENNRVSFWVRGFGKSSPNEAPPSGKVKIDMANSALPRSMNLRAKTGTPAQIAKYLADYLNKVVREVPPKFTHTRM